MYLGTFEGLAAAAGKCKINAVPVGAQFLGFSFLRAQGVCWLRSLFVPLFEDCDAETEDVLSDAGEVERAESEAEVIIRETFDHLGRSMDDEVPRDPDDEMY